MELSGRVKYYVGNIEHIVYVTDIEYTASEFKRLFTNFTFVSFV